MIMNGDFLVHNHDKLFEYLLLNSFQADLKIFYATQPSALAAQLLFARFSNRSTQVQA